jgi:hypothetical protein
MSADVTERTAPTNTDVVVKSGNAAIAGFQELAKAYQALATKNAERLSSSLQALAAAKSTTELMALQGKLMSEAVDAAVKDSSNIARLTTAVFTAAFEPMTKPMAALHRPASV